MASMDSEQLGRLQHYSWAINTATLDKAMTKILDSGGCVILSEFCNLECQSRFSVSDLLLWVCAARATTRCRTGLLWMLSGWIGGSRQEDHDSKEVGVPPAGCTE